MDESASAFPTFVTPAPQMGTDSPTPSPTVSKMPSSQPSSSSPTFSPIVRMQANVLLALHNVPERTMEEGEVEVFIEETLEFLRKHTEQTLILDEIDVWHQQMVEVASVTSGILADEFDDADANMTESLMANATRDDENTTHSSSTNASIVNEGGTAYGFADLSSENSHNEIANSFATPENNDAADAMAGGFADFSNGNTNSEMASGFANPGDNNVTDAMAGGFADFNSERSDAGQRHRRNKAGGGSSGISGSSGGLSQEKLDKIIAFKQKHSDRGPKTTGNQVTLILRIPFAYLPEDLLGKFVSVVIEEHGVDLVSSLRSHSAFYSYFKDLTAVSSDVVGELTMPPTNMPTSYIQFIALKKDEQVIMMEDGQSFATVSLFLRLLRASAMTTHFMHYSPTLRFKDGMGFIAAVLAFLDRGVDLLSLQSTNANEREAQDGGVIESRNFEFKTTYQAGTEWI